MNPSWSLPPSMFQVRGAIGKQFVLKRYGKKTVVTKYPDMTRIVPTTKQKIRRRLFARAVRYAQSIYWKPEQKEEWRRKLRRPKRLFQALMKQYYKQIRQREERAERRIRIWRGSVEGNNELLQRALFQNAVPPLSLIHVAQQVRERKELLLE